MTRFLCMLTFLLTLLSISPPARAQAAPEWAKLTVDGVEGIWIPSTAHRLILADLREIPEQRTRVKLLEEKLSLQTGNLKDLRLAVAVTTEARKEAVGALGAAVRGKREAEEDRDSWLRSPVLWAGIGLAGGIAITVAVGFLVTRATER